MYTGEGGRHPRIYPSSLRIESKCAREEAAARISSIVNQERIINVHVRSRGVPEEGAKNDFLQF